MVEADTHVVWDQFNMEGLKGPALCSRGRTTIESGKVEFVATDHYSCVIFCFDIAS